MDKQSSRRDAWLMIVGGISSTVLLAATYWGLQLFSSDRKRDRRGDSCPATSKQDAKPSTAQHVDGLLGLIGNTPLIKINSLSEETGCLILGKAEFLNPGGSVKDRVALQIVQEAIQDGRLQPGGLITEGTAGSTGISLTLVAAAYGCRCFIALPDDAAIEKAETLVTLGAEVRRVRPVSITNPEHHVNVARRRAESELQGTALFADQFENPANLRAHLKTGEEIWKQTGGQLHAFVSGAGTGGTIAGVSQYLKAKDPNIQIFLIDPPGSSLYNKVVRGVLYTREEAEGRRLRNPFDTITEGIGLNRLTHNFQQAHIDGAFKGTDQEAVDMAAYLLRNDGLFIGSSAAMNCVGAVKAARLLGPGHTIVTLLCDGGSRHLSKFHNRQYLDSQGLLPKAVGIHLEFANHMSDPGVPADEGPVTATSWCLMLQPDDADGEAVKRVKFERDERGSGSIDDAAAAVLGIPGERVRCFSLPGGYEKKLGLSLHLYIDLQGLEHNLAHNTNATQLFLISHLPAEPPEVFPASIHGPVLLSAEAFKTEEYKDLDLEDWAKIKGLCKAVQPNAIFIPYEEPKGETDRTDD